MIGMERRSWTNNEQIKVLALYCQLPFGKMHARHPAVITLASKIGRTPSAVALKLVNFASLDPELREKGIGGMPNISQADKRVWKQYYGKWGLLADVSTIDVVAKAERVTIIDAEIRQRIGPTEIVRQTKVRRGQAFFRAAVMAAHAWKCCVTGISALELLRASHIVPWSMRPEMRLNPRNGLCLNALHDAAFDRGLITFSNKFELCLSRQLKKEVPVAIFNEMFEKYCGVPITMPERFFPTTEMIDFHRTTIFCG
jgi:hypothetical protein